MSYVNTGRQIVGTLRQVAVYPDASRVLTGVTKPNDPDDPDYIEPIDDTASHIACPVPTTTTTTTTSTTSTTTTTTTLAPNSPNSFTLFAAYGMTIVSVSGSSTGVPSAFASANVPPTTSLVKPIGALPAQTFTIVLTGTPVIPIKLDLDVNGGNIDTVTIPAAGSYTLTLPTGLSAGDYVYIAVDSI